MALQDGRSRAVWKPPAVVRALGGQLLDLLFPPSTLESDAAPAQTVGLSAAAWAKIRFLEAPVCDMCGGPFEYDMGDGVRCAACEAKPRAFHRARAACEYDEASRELILMLKHADRTDVAPLLASWLTRAASELLEDSDAVVPVPLHPWRLFLRRYNQAAEIARPLAVRSGLAFLPDVLRRVRDTGTQGGRSGGARRRNVAAAFGVPPRLRRQVEGRRILLVDDVLTTGATAEGCARALKAAGAARVNVAVVARVKDRQIGPI